MILKFILHHFCIFENLQKVKLVLIKNKNLINNLCLHIANASAKVVGDKKTMTKKFFSVVASSLTFLFISLQNVLADWDPYAGTYTGLPDATIYDIITNILDWLLTIIGIVGVIAFVISGLMYLTSAGDEKKIATAKNAMTNAIIGVIVAIVGVVVLQAVDTMLNAGYMF